MASHTVSIELPDPLGGYVRDRFAEGEFVSEADNLRELTRRDREMRSARRIRALVDEGLASGPATPLTDAELGVIRQRIGSSRP